MPKRDSLKVPEAMQPLYGEITSISDSFCKEHLNEEYAELARKMTATLARKRPSPLVNGRANGWAAGILYALGQINFLFDKSQTPHLRADELCRRIGVSQQTASGRAQKIRTVLNTSLMDPKWTLPSRMDDNPMAWYIMVNGLIVDARRVPREVQAEAYRKGLIPYIPADRALNDYGNIIQEHLDNIREDYLKFADEKPIILYDVQVRALFTYPFQTFREGFDPEHQALLDDEYQQAVKAGRIVVLIKDNKRFALYTVDIEENDA
jgi:hypothetical protein